MRRLLAPTFVALALLVSAVSSQTPDGLPPALQGGGENSAPARPPADGQDPAAQDQHSGNHQLIQLFILPAKAKVGDTVVVEARVAMDPGWHNYGAMQNPELGVPTSFSVKSAALVAQGAAEVPPGDPHEVGGDLYHYLEGSFVLRQKFVVQAEAKEGEVPVQASVVYMACDDSQCDSDVTAQLKGTLTVVPGGDAAQAAAKTKAAAAQTKTQGAQKQSLWLYLLGAVGAGLFALVMPCTYPMIPITISFFTKQAETRGGSVLGLALIYGAGIILSFVLMGALILGINLDPQQFAGNEWLNLAFGLMFVLFALSLFGLLNMQPPQFLMNLSGKASGVGGPIGVLLLGMTLCISSFTCTAPVLGLMIGAALSGGDGFRLILGMAVFGLTMAAPFVWLSLVPGKLPRSGAWMNSVKILFGFIELAAALKFFSNADVALNLGLLPREVFLALWSALFSVAGFYLLGFIKFKGETGEIGGGRLLSGTLSVCLGFYFLIGALGVRYNNMLMSAMEPPYTASVDRSGGGGKKSHGNHNRSGSHEIVSDDFEAGVKLALTEKKLVLLNFTGII